jgi:hemoglobin/transferrin/lactoferrin receptor protein
MKHVFFVFVLFLEASLLFAQKVEVKDNTNLQPLPDVYIYCAGNSVTTNAQGYADISSFSREDSILFLRQSYKKLVISYADLERVGFKVKMIESAIELNVFEVSENKWEQSKHEVPAKISSIDRKHISFENPQTAADLLNVSEEVFVQKSQMGGGSPMIRGFAANRLLIVVDGVRMNNAIYRSGNLQNVISLDAASIEKTEVVFGPGSVMYGSDAIGGVMDFYTLKPRLSVANVSEYTGSAWMRYSSANQERSTHFDFNFGRCHFASTTSFTFSEFGDLSMGTIGFKEYQRPEYVQRFGDSDQVLLNSNPNKQVQTAYNQLNLMQKFRFKDRRFSNWVYAFHYSRTTDVPRYDRLIQYKGDQLKYAEWYYGPQVWMMNSITYLNRKKRKWSDKIKMIIARQDYQESRHSRKLHDDYRYDRYEKVEVYTFNFDLEKKLKKEAGVFYGVDASFNRVGSTADAVNIVNGDIGDYASRYPDASLYANVGLYGNYKKRINPKLTFVSGIRYSYVFVQADFDTTFYPFPFQDILINTGAVNASAGLVWRPDDSWQINTSLASGFRAPNIDDVGKVFDSEPGSVVVPNPDLKPEYAYNLDFGAEKSFGDFLQIEMTAFGTLLHNAMVRRDYQFDGQDSIYYDGELSRVQALVNTGEAYVYGVHIGLNADISTPIIIKAHFTYTKGMERDEANDELIPLRHAAPAFGSLHFVYQIKRFRADLYGRYNAMVAYEDMPTSEIGKTYMYATNALGKPYSPAWGTLNFKAMFQINRHLQLNAGIENITNLRYRPYSSGIVAAGRNFILALRGTF